jgi:hypothetical protein
MTTHTRTRPVSAVAYYLGRPAEFWLTIYAPRSTTRKKLGSAGNVQLMQLDRQCANCHRMIHVRPTQAELRALITEAANQ